MADLVAAPYAQELVLKAGETLDLRSLLELLKPVNSAKGRLLPYGFQNVVIQAFRKQPTGALSQSVSLPFILQDFPKVYSELYERGIERIEFPGQYALGEGEPGYFKSGTNVLKAVESDYFLVIQATVAFKPSMLQL